MPRGRRVPDPRPGDEEDRPGDIRGREEAAVSRYFSAAEDRQDAREPEDRQPEPERHQDEDTVQLRGERDASEQPCREDVPGAAADEPFSRGEHRQAVEHRAGPVLRVVEGMAERRGEEHERDGGEETCLEAEEADRVVREEGEGERLEQHHAEVVSSRRIEQAERRAPPPRPPRPPAPGGPGSASGLLVVAGEEGGSRGSGREAKFNASGTRDGEEEGPVARVVEAPARRRSRRAAGAGARRAGDRRAPPGKARTASPAPASYRPPLRVFRLTGSDSAAAPADGLSTSRTM